MVYFPSFYLTIHAGLVVLRDGTIPELAAWGRKLEFQKENTEP